MKGGGGWARKGESGEKRVGYGGKADRGEKWESEGEGKELNT